MGQGRLFLKGSYSSQGGFPPGPNCFALTVLAFLAFLALRTVDSRLTGRMISPFYRGAEHCVFIRPTLLH